MVRHSGHIVMYRWVDEILPSQFSEGGSQSGSLPVLIFFLLSLPDHSQLLSPAGGGHVRQGVFSSLNHIVWRNGFWRQHFMCLWGRNQIFFSLSLGQLGQMLLSHCPTLSLETYRTYWLSHRLLGIVHLPLRGTSLLQRIQMCPVPQ